MREKENPIAGEGGNRRYARHPLAAPSWVIPGSILENARFLEDKADEIGLLFLETSSCLAYGRQDLPLELASLPLSWHAHLPLDLPWSGKTIREPARICVTLMEKIRVLGARRAVLHPPPGPADFAAACFTAFAQTWKEAGRAPADVLIENTRDNDLVALMPHIENIGFGLCLDLGHLLLQGEESLARPLPCPSRIGMVHLNAPDPEGSDRHFPLTALGEEGCLVGRRLLAALPPEAVVMLECFSWTDIEASLPIVDAWLMDSAQRK